MAGRRRDSEAENMVNESGADIPRASSEPDLGALASLYQSDLALNLDVSPASSGDDVHTPPPPLTIAPPTLSVTFSDYVETELARSAAPPLPPTPGRTKATDISLFLAPDSSPRAGPRSPRSPSVPVRELSRGFVESGEGRAHTFDGGIEDFNISADLDHENSGDALSFSPLTQRQHRLNCVEIDDTGAMRRRALTRNAILAESRETLRKSHPSPADAAQWMRQLDARDEGHSPEMESFATLVDGRESVDYVSSPIASSRGELRRMRRTAREKLRGYLRNYLRNSLQPRDIRQVDPAFAAKTALWVRHTALVFSMEKLRAIIFRTKIFLFDTDSKSTSDAVELTRKLVSARTDNGTPIPFELRALEALLIHVVGKLEREFTELKPFVQGHLSELPDELTTKKLEDLRLLKQRLSHLRSRAAVVQEELEKLLDEDEDMANMYLTEKHMSHEGARNIGDHDEVEMLLEAYLQGVDEIVNQTTLLSDNIEDTEDLVMIHLDTLRNRLLSIELGLSVVSMTFGVGSVLSGIFGMNLPIPLFDEGVSPYWFLGVTILILVFIVVVSWSVLRVLRQHGLYSFS